MLLDFLISVRSLNYLSFIIIINLHRVLQRMGSAASRELDIIVDDGALEDSQSFSDTLRLNLQRLLIYAKSSDPILQRDVAERLANEAVSPERQAQIVECGGIKLLVQLTRSTDTEVQRLSAHALANLSALPINQKAMAEAEGSLDMLVELLKSPCAEVQRQAAKTIANMSVIASNMHLIADKKGLPSLIALVSVPQIKTRIEAIAAIANLAIDDANERALVEEGAIVTILDCLRPIQPTDVDFLSQIARALRNLTHSPDNSAVLKAAGGVPLLDILAKHPEERVRAQAMAALANVKK